MFLIKDTLDARQQKIRSFLEREPAIAVILAAADFEWTVRRAILALGCSPTKEIHDRWDKQKKSPSGLRAYQDEWRREVTPRTGSALDEVVPDWEFFKNTAYQLRHKLVHGAAGGASVRYASRMVTSILGGTKALAEHAGQRGAPVYGKKIIRYKRRS